MRKIFLENVGLKISAVLISVFLWLFVTSRGQSELSLEIPLEFKNIPVGLGIVNNSARAVNVTIRGQERLMKSVRPSNVRVFVDLSKAKKGEAIYYINKDDIRLPYAMTVINITPSSIKIRVDETLMKLVPVKPSLSGSPERGYSVTSVDLDPPQVKILGLRSEVRKVSDLKTEMIDITGLTETMTQEINLEVPGANIKPEPSTVKVRITIREKKK